MPQAINVITLPLPLGIGSVNSYLLQAGNGYLLVDTGAPKARRMLRSELEGAGCRVGSLRLTVLTHGDFDHTGNAAYMRTTFGGKIAMHADDARMAEVGDMFVNRKRSNFILRVAIPRLIGFGKSEQFTPDVLLEDGSSLSEYGLEATVIWLPGHSKGSVGILTADGHFFCGDLFDNIRKPALGSIMDDHGAANWSAARLGTLKIGPVYPGHGKPFSMGQLSEKLT